jgi:hypothetical protein
MFTNIRGEMHIPGSRNAPQGAGHLCHPGIPGSNGRRIVDERQAAGPVDSFVPAGRASVHDRRDDQIETGGAIALVLDRAVGDPTLPVHMYRMRQKMPDLALVEAQPDSAGATRGFPASPR